MIYVFVDVVITRRKRFHLITNDEWSPLHRTRLMGEIMEWLRAEGVEEYTVVTELGAFRVNAQACDRPEGVA